jgi:hypothetical protein
MVHSSALAADGKHLTYGGFTLGETILLLELSVHRQLLR